jgi:hypothetical protein
MGNPVFDGYLQVAFIERDQKVQTLAPEAATQALTYRVGRGCLNRSSQYSHAEVRHLLIECTGENAVPIMNHKPVWMVMRQDLSKLLQRPFRRRVRSDVAVDDPPAAQLQDHKYIKDTEGGRDHDKEITCDDHLA